MTILLAFVSLGFLFASVVAQEPACARSYIVKPGDDCDTISAVQNVSTFQLAHVNPKINAFCSNLFAGESLCLGVKGQDCNITTIVYAGEGCQEISINAGISISLLLKNNPNVNSTCGNVYPGEVLCTADVPFVNSAK